MNAYDHGSPRRAGNRARAADASAAAAGPRRRAILRAALACIVTATALAAGTRAHADIRDPRELVDMTIERLRGQIIRDQALIERDPAHAMQIVETTVAPHVDMVLASRLVLGRYWQSATPAQRAAFADGLERLLMRIFAIHVRDYTDVDVEFSRTEYRGERKQRATVRTRVSRAGTPPVNVDYRLYRTNKEWKVYDVAIFGVSLVKTYHMTIATDLEKLGIDAVIDQINARNPLPVPAPQGASGSG